MSTSAGKTEYLFYRAPPNGCLFIVSGYRPDSKGNQSWSKNKYFHLFLSWNKNKHFHFHEIKTAIS